ncbi:MAG: sugar phosphate isomerase/epimerase [Ruminococcaceae bacterium]|nr:sugar phosphate isomerase/epimerase [Oscillospiraceae bacterium]
MKLVTQTDYLAEHFGLAAAVDMLADAGYDGIDFSAYASEEYYTDAHPASFYTELRARAEERGVPFVQAHAPHGSSFQDEAQTARRFDEIVTSMKHAALLGASCIVVHPCQHLHYILDPEAPERLFEINMDFYRRLFPYAEEYGIRVMTENMWNFADNVIVHSTCSRPSEMIRYFDELDHPLFGCCLDIGHTALVREDAAAFIRALGNKRLACLHVHDVDGTHDSHTVPYFGGAIGWDRVMEALAEIGYTGNLTYEADCFFAPLPEALAPDAARFMASIGRTLVGKFEAYRK